MIFLFPFSHPHVLISSSNVRLYSSICSVTVCIISKDFYIVHVNMYSDQLNKYCLNQLIISGMGLWLVSQGTLPLPPFLIAVRFASHSELYS